MLKTLALTVLLLSLALAGNAQAHGDEAHAKPAGVSKEQQPWGIAGEGSRVSRTVTIRMLDTMRFRPDRIRVRLGETIRFELRNEGRMLHEMVIGTRAALEEHAALMRRFPDMEHDAPWMAHVGPGQRGEIVWHFNRAGRFAYACLIPGHFDAGMVGEIEVVP